jgi:hypothetical protein
MNVTLYSDRSPLPRLTTQPHAKYVLMSAKSLYLELSYLIVRRGVGFFPTGFRVSRPIRTSITSVSVDGITMLGAELRRRGKSRGAEVAAGERHEVHGLGVASGVGGVC